MLRKLKRPWCWITKHDWRFNLRSHCYARGYVPPVEYCKCYRCGKIDRVSVVDRIVKKARLKGWTVDSGETQL